MENLTIQSTRPQIGLTRVFQESMPFELNIYGQAHIEQEKSVTKQNKSLKATVSEIGVCFDLNGSLEGKVICLLDTKDRNIDTKELLFFKSLFIESMNIFSGQLVTNIENQFDRNSLISNPAFIELGKELEISLRPENLLLLSDYKFISTHDEFDCRIIIDIKKN